MAAGSAIATVVKIITAVAGAASAGAAIYQTTEARKARIAQEEQQTAALQAQMARGAGPDVPSAAEESARMAAERRKMRIRASQMKGRESTLRTGSRFGDPQAVAAAQGRKTFG